MKKKTIALLTAAIILIVSAIVPVFAYATETASWKDAPASSAGYWGGSRDNYFSCKTEKDVSIAQGSDTYALFKGYGTLQSNFSSGSGRKITVKLMEYDGVLADDEVKVYVGSFSDRKITGIYYNKTSMSGNIEGVGDKTAELYILYKVDKLSGDPTTPLIASGLFQYKVGIN